MAGGYDGSIRIDTLINTLPINNGLNQIESKVKALGSAIGLALGAKELIGFGKNAVEAASDLTEAQNVVDTAFGSMSYKMEQFAATALEVYGISELTAKNMGSTYMAMAKGMGVATDAASDMAVTLTGRLADIMSFYNKTQEQVDTIGRSLITGETEPLKAIGVVMTQTNLEAYAMAQGFSKTYSEMSANEQLLVRYKYFLEQTAMAQGDFADTSEMELDTTAADEWLDSYLKNKLENPGNYEQVVGVTSSYAQQPGKAGAPADRNLFEFLIHIDNEQKGTVEVIRQTAPRGIDLWVDNGKARGRN